MSLELDAVFQQGYDAEVKRAYDQTTKLETTVRVKRGVVGDRYNFRKSGKGMATRHNKGANVVAMNTEFTEVPCVLEEWEAFDYSDNFDKTKINFDEISILGKTAGDALARRKDQLIIDGLKIGYNETDMTVGDSTKALTIDTLIEAKEKLDDLGVPEENRTLILTATQMGDLLRTTQITSSEYNDIRALVLGTVKKYLGFDIMTIGKRKEGGLPDTADGKGYIGFAYHKEAVGLALGRDIDSRIDYIPEKVAYLVGGIFMGNAVVIDDEGVVAVVSAKRTKKTTTESGS